MSKELPYFKFNVSEWILGRISDQSDKVQGAFIIAICHYWHKNCDYSVTDFTRKIGKNRFKLLKDLKFIEIENDKVLISFLDEQFNELSDIHSKRVKSGQAGGIASAEAKRKPKPKHLDKDIEQEEDNSEIINPIPEDEKIKLRCIELFESYTSEDRRTHPESVTKAYGIPFDYLKNMEYVHKKFNEFLHIIKTEPVDGVFRKEIEIFNHFKKWMKYQVESDKDLQNVKKLLLKK